MATVPSRSPSVHCEPSAAEWTEYFALCDSLGRIPTDADLDAIDGDHFPDEAPELDPSAYYEPTEDDEAWWAVQAKGGGPC